MRCVAACALLHCLTAHIAHRAGNLEAGRVVAPLVLRLLQRGGVQPGKYLLALRCFGKPADLREALFIFAIPVERKPARVQSVR
jgi:hypothetical protein